MYEVPKAIENLDFRMLSRKLEHKSGPDWPHEKIQAVQKEYKRFLGLKYIFPEAILVPDESVDTFWHYHISDTRAYARDCDRVFGQFIHHNPYFGIRSEADEARLKEAFDSTVGLYREIYGPSQRNFWLKAAVCSLG